MKIYYVETNGYDMLVADDDGTITYFIGDNDARRNADGDQVYGDEAHDVCEKFLRKADLDPSGWELFDGSIDEILNEEGNIVHAEIEVE